MLGQPASHVLPGDKANQTEQANLRESLRLNRPFQYDMPNARGGGAQWLRVSVRPVRDATSADSVHHVGLVEDITAEREFRLRLLASEERFRSLAENVPGALYEWRKLDSGEYFFEYVSPKVREIFGIEPASLARMTDFIHPDELENFLLTIDQATRTPRAVGV